MSDSITPESMVVRVLENCTGCGCCLPLCPVAALTLDTDQPQGWGRKRAVVKVALCLGCGACTPSCPRCALVMERRT